MNIVALYKTWQGEEFVEASIESVYPHVSKMVFVHSKVSWQGEEGNTVMPIVNRWRLQRDVGNKMFDIVGNFTDQNDQYNAGIDYIRHLEPDYDYIWLVDTDEVWEDKHFMQAKRALSRPGYTTRFNVFTCSLFTYVKSIFYRIDPIEHCEPSVFITKNVKRFDTARGWDIPLRYYIQRVFFHHFTLVRSSEEKVFKKIQVSNLGDVVGTDDNHKLVPNWIEEKWNKIPNVSDFHYQEKYADWWKGVKEISIEDLPITLRNKPIVNKFLKESDNVL